MVFGDLEHGELPLGIKNAFFVPVSELLVNQALFPAFTLLNGASVSLPGASW